MKYAIAPEGTKRFYLTVGKRYAVIKECYDFFHINDDDGCNLYCLYKNCGHLNGKDWIIVDEPDVPSASAGKINLTVKTVVTFEHGCDASARFDSGVVISDAERYVCFNATELDWLIAALTKIKGLTNGV